MAIYLGDKLIHLPYDGKVESIVTYTHEEVWTTDALGNSLNFFNTYFDYQNGSNWELKCKIAIIDNTFTSGVYWGEYALMYPYINTMGGITCRNNHSNIASQISTTRSFYIGANSKITVITIDLS